MTSASSLRILYKFNTFQTRFKFQFTYGLYFSGAFIVYFLNFFKVASYISGLAPSIEKFTCSFKFLFGIFLITFPCITLTGSVAFFLIESLRFSIELIFFYYISGSSIDFSGLLLNCWYIVVDFSSFSFLLYIFASAAFFTSS